MVNKTLHVDNPTLHSRSHCPHRLRRNTCIGFQRLTLWATIGHSVFPTDPSPDLLPPSHTPLNRGLIAVAAALVTLWTAACGDGTTDPIPPPNRPPVPSGTIPALTVAAGNTATVNVASYFSDPDGDALVYTAASSNPQTAMVAVSGSVVTVTATARGETTVTVTASDPGGLSAQATFSVTVPNQAPVAVDSIPAQAVFVGDTVEVDVNAYFNDPDGDALAYSAPSSNSTVVSTSVSGSVVSISAIATGTAVITVTATDLDGLATQSSFEVSVPQPGSGLRRCAPRPNVGGRTGGRGRRVATLRRS